MSKVSRSPFGPAADKAIEVRQAATVEEALSMVEPMMDAAKKLADQYKRLAEREQAKRIEAEQRLQRYREDIDSKKIDLEAQWDVLVREIGQRVDEAQSLPELREALDRLVAAEADTETLRVLLAEAEAQRDAALRARDALAARLDHHPALEPSSAQSVRSLLEADTLAGVLQQATNVCSLLQITADPDDAASLEHHTKARLWRGRLADTLAAMQAYAEVKSLVKARGKAAGPALVSLLAYCASEDMPLLSPDKIKLNDSRFALNESQSRGQRLLPVPVEISPSGRMLMRAHILIGDGQPPAPRLYFHDATDTSNGTIVVGYFGDHLKNASTN